MKGDMRKRRYPKNWAKLRKLVFTRDKGLCVQCLKRDEYTPASEIDHIVPLSIRSDNRLSNLQSLCSACHDRKTASEQRRLSGICDHGYLAGMYCPECKNVVNFIPRKLDREGHYDRSVTACNLDNNPNIRQHNNSNLKKQVPVRQLQLK